MDRQKNARGDSKKGSESQPNSLFDFDYQQNHPGSVGDDDANFASPTSSQFVRRDKKAKGSEQNQTEKNMVHKRVTDLQAASSAHNNNESLEDALVDLYLSVKIRSNEEVSSRKSKNATFATHLCRLTPTTRESLARRGIDCARRTPSPSWSTSKRALKS